MNSLTSFFVGLVTFFSGIFGFNGNQVELPLGGAPVYKNFTTIEGKKIPLSKITPLRNSVYHVMGDHVYVFTGTESSELKFKMMDKVSATTFSYLSNKYAHDERNVYYLGEIVPSADPLTFVSFDIQGDIWKDKNNFYKDGKIIPSDEIKK